RVVAGVGGAGIVIVAVDRIVGTAVGPALVDGAGVAVIAVERHSRHAEVVGPEREAGFLAVARIAVVARVGVLAAECLAAVVGRAGEMVVAIDRDVRAAVVSGTGRAEAPAEARHAIGRPRALPAVGCGEGRSEEDGERDPPDLLSAGRTTHRGVQAGSAESWPGERGPPAAREGARP